MVMARLALALSLTAAANAAASGAVSRYDGVVMSAVVSGDHTPGSPAGISIVPRSSLLGRPLSATEFGPVRVSQGRAIAAPSPRQREPRPASTRRGTRRGPFGPAGRTQPA